MPIDRDALHRLVDTLPEGALEPARNVLEQFQVWPPQPPPEIERMRQQHLERMRASMRPGMSGTGGGGGSCRTGSGGRIESGVFSFNRSEDGVMVYETHRFHKGHELTIIERLRESEDGRALIYGHEVTGPDGKRDGREVVFRLREN
jgi:hypothetical protein